MREETGIEALDFPWGEVVGETPPYGRGKVARYDAALSPNTAAKLPVSPEPGRPEHHEYRWLDYGAAGTVLVPGLEKGLQWARRTADCAP